MPTRRSDRGMPAAAMLCRQNRTDTNKLPPVFSGTRMDGKYNLQISIRWKENTSNLDNKRT